MRVIDALPSHHAAIFSIRNDVVATTTAIYEDRPATADEARAWFREKEHAGAPVLVAVDDFEEVLGYATYGPFNPKPGYRFTVEHSVHVAAAHRGRGVGRALLKAILERAETAGMHAMVGLIDAANIASRRLHESEGFALAGTLPELGRKFDRWLNVCYYVKRLGGA